MRHCYMVVNVQSQGVGRQGGRAQQEEGPRRQEEDGVKIHSHLCLELAKTTTSVWQEPGSFLKGRGGTWASVPATDPDVLNI